MRLKWWRGRDLEGMLRRSFPDDLPADIGAYLDGAFDDFRRKMAEEGDEAPRAADAEKPARPHPSTPIRTWWKPVAALASLALAVFGAGFRVADAASSWASPLLLWQTRAGLQRAIHRAASMEASVETRRADGHPVVGVIRWRAPGPADVGDGIADPGARQALETLGARLEPPALARQLNGDWSIRPPAEGQAVLRATVRPPGGGDEILIEVDGATCLPVQVAAAGGEFAANLHWTLRDPGSRTILRQAGPVSR